MNGRGLLIDRLRAWSGSSWKLPVMGGFLLAVGSYTPLPFLNILAFTPLLLRLDARPGGRRVAGFRPGFFFGLLFYGVGLHFFLGLIPVTWLAGLLYVGFVLIMALRVGLQVLVLGWLRQRTDLSFGLLLPLAWLPFEWVQTFGDLRMTGDHLAYGLTGSPFLIQFADLVGPYGVTLVLLTSSGLVFESLFPRPGRRRAAWVTLCVILGAVLVYDGWAWNREIPESGRLSVAIVQPDVPLAEKMDSRSTADSQWQTLVELTREAASQRPDLIVWPESARPRPLFHWRGRDETYAMPDVQALAREVGVPILAGVEYVDVRAGDDFDLYNAAILVGRDGRLDPTWLAKTYLVPFAEALPFSALLGPWVEGRGGEWRWIAGGFKPGPRDVVLAVNGARVGVIVCFEQLFQDLAREKRNLGANVQVVITNDAWWGRTAFQGYQANALRLRAIENRTAFVRVANTGISGFVDAHGRYLQQTPLFERAVEVREIRLHDAKTLYDGIGDACPAIVSLALLMVGLYAAIPSAAYRA